MDRVAAAIAEVAHVVKVVDHRLIVLLAAVVLLLEDAARGAIEPRRHHHQVVLQQVDDLVGRVERTGVDLPVLTKIERRQAAERGDVLVLLSDRFLQQIQLDVAGHLGQLAGMDEVPLLLVEDLEQAGGEAARGAEAGPRGNVGDAGDLQVGRGDAGELERLADDRVADLVDGLHPFDLGVAEQHLLERRQLAGHVHVLGDRRRQNEAAVLLVVRRQVGAAAPRLIRRGLRPMIMEAGLTAKSGRREGAPASGSGRGRSEVAEPQRDAEREEPLRLHGEVRV